MIRALDREFVVRWGARPITSMTRHDVVAVIDLARFLGMPATIAGDDGRIVVLRHKTRVAGVLVDRMAEVRVVPLEQIAPPPATITAEIASLLRGIAIVPAGWDRASQVGVYITTGSTDRPSRAASATTMSLWEKS